MIENIQDNGKWINFGSTVCQVGNILSIESNGICEIIVYTKTDRRFFFQFKDNESMEKFFKDFPPFLNSRYTILDISDLAEPPFERKRI